MKHKHEMKFIENRKYRYRNLKTNQNELASQWKL